MKKTYSYHCVVYGDVVARRDLWFSSYKTLSYFLPKYWEILILDQDADDLEWIMIAVEHHAGRQENAN